jgi:hypothetical protein
MNGQEITIIHEKPLTSALKIFYLGIFIYTAITIFSAFVGHVPDIYQKLEADTLPWFDGCVIIVVLFLLPISVGIHFLRIYITMEMLEDPTSPFHKRYLTPLNQNDIKVEHVIRFFAIIFVSFKLIEEIFNFKVFDNLHHLCWYLLFFYSSLLIWDIWIYYCHKSKGSGFSLCKDTYFKMNILSLIAVGFALLLSKGTPKSYIALSFFLSIIIVVTVLSFINDGKNRKQGFNERTVWYELKRIMMSIFNPYYGKNYVISEEKIYRDIPDKPFSGSCVSNDCRYKEDSLTVLKSIE